MYFIFRNSIYSHSRSNRIERYEGTGQILEDPEVRSSLHEFRASFVAIAKNLLRHFISLLLQTNGGREVFCPLVRSFYPSVRHADVDRSTMYIWVFCY